VRIGQPRDERLGGTSAVADGSSSDPSSARAASPALSSMSSTIFESMVCAAMMRHAAESPTARRSRAVIRAGPGPARSTWQCQAALVPDQPDQVLA
jgi:hypothetical protein